MKKEQIINKPLIYTVSLLILLIVFVFWCVGIGVANISFSKVLAIIKSYLPFVGASSNTSNISEGDKLIIMNIRLPRILLAVIVGSSLAMVGVVFQGLLLNPLADPYTVGISFGAAFGATIAILLQAYVSVFHHLMIHVNIIPFFAFAGAVLALLLVYNLAKIGGIIVPETLILAGVIVSAFLSAFISFFKSIAGENLTSIVFWIMGSLTGKGWSYVVMILPYFFICAGIIIFYSNDLDIISFGESTAKHLGVDVNKVRIILLVTSSLLTAAAVSVSGVIGFVGLIVPHLMRILIGPKHFWLIVTSCLAGAILLVLADTFARTAVGASEIPVGVLTAMLGGPFFCFLLKSKKRKEFFGAK